MFKGSRISAYTLPRVAWLTISLFSLPMVGKYRPTQVSNKAKLQNVTASPRARTGRKNDIAAKARMLSSIRLTSRSDFSSTKEKTADPIIIAAMKQLKIRPKGGASMIPEATLTDFRAGVQKKTKRNIEPSNSVVARPSVKILLSCMVARKLAYAVPFSSSALP